MANPVPILAAAFIIVFLLSLFIAGAVAKHAAQSYSRLVHLFVALVALYYLLDAFFQHEEKFFGPFALFWTAVIAGQIGLFLYKRKSL